VRVNDGCVAMRSLLSMGVLLPAFMCMEEGGKKKSQAQRTGCQSSERAAHRSIVDEVDSQSQPDMHTSKGETQWMSLSSPKGEATHT